MYPSKRTACGMRWLDPSPRHLMSTGEASGSRARSHANHPITRAKRHRRVIGAKREDRAISGARETAVQFLLRPAAHAKVIDGDGLYAIFLERMALCHEQLMVLMIKLCHTAVRELASGRVNGFLKDGFSAL